MCRIFLGILPNIKPDADWKEYVEYTLTITAKKGEFDSFLAKEFNGERFITIRKEDITS
jgi:hypothetical protein